MSKMGSHNPFRHLKHKLWPKERSKVKLAVWFLITKIKNRLNFLACRWRETYRWKAFNKGYNFALNLILIKVLHTKLLGPKIARVSALGISGLSFGSPGTKCHLDVGLVESHRIYYKGEGGGFPQAWVVVNLMNQRLVVACPNTKNA
jgi:hypothetical protein